MISKTQLVLPIECPPKLRRIVWVLPGNGEVMSLSLVTAVCGDARRSSRECGGGSAGKSLKCNRKVGDRRGAQEHALDHIASVGRHDESERGQDTRVAGHEDPRDPDGFGDLAGVEWARAAERDECKVTRVEPPLNAHMAKGINHTLNRHEQDALGARSDRQAELVGEGFDRRGGELGIEAKVRPKVDAVQTPEHDVCVRHGRRSPAATVGRRSGLGASRPRTDAQRPTGVAPGDASTPRRDGVHVDCRKRQCVSSDDRGGRPPRTALSHRRHIAGRPAHVEREDVRLIERSGK